jgi:2-iminobutanoate/2-iminopropanoate deaminase
MAKMTLNPDGLPVPRGSYSLVNIAQPGRMVFIAGQTASDHEGKVIGVGHPRAQTRFVLGKIRLAVEAAGGAMADIVAMNVFTTDVRYHRDINETRRQLGGHPLAGLSSRHRVSRGEESSLLPLLLSNSSTFDRLNYAPLFSVGRCRTCLGPHQSPIGIKALGDSPKEKFFPPLASYLPQKTVGATPCPRL